MNDGFAEQMIAPMTAGSEATCSIAANEIGNERR